MSLVRLENVTKRFGGEPILDGVSFRVEQGEKVGLIGRNGTGKSTLFKLILGEIEPESGTIERMKRARFACLAQLPEMRPTDTIFDTVVRSFDELQQMEHRLAEFEERIAAGEEGQLGAYSTLQEEFQRRGGYEFRITIDQVLHGLGFTRDEFGLPVTALSGGQRTRLLLALVLLEEADLLLLDEPENHLDLHAREWLETFLIGTSKAFVVISHDRQLLNAVTNRIVEVERAALQGFTGNYDAYVANKELIHEQHQKAFLRQQRFIEKEQSWINRFRYKNTKARQVQSRVKRLEKLERLEAPASEMRGPRFTMGEVVRSGAVVLEGKDLSVVYGDLALYSRFSIQVERGQRIGIVGPNGSGKTTLLRHLAGELNAGAGTVSGTISLGTKVHLGFYDQHHEGLHPGNDIFTEIRNVRTEMSPEEVRSFMGRFLFSGEDIFKPISALSGGELSRVAIAKLILGESNLLLLDEPTNHLDIATQEVLEEALDQYDGALLVASHDRALIDRLSEKLLIVEKGTIQVHLGNYSDYRAGRAISSGGSPESSPPLNNPDEVMRIRASSPARGKGRSRERERERDERRRRRQLEDLERTIAAVEEIVASMESEFSRIDPSDYERGRTLKAEYDGLKEDLQRMYAEWEAVVGETGEKAD